MRQVTGILAFEPPAPGLHLITDEIAAWLAAQGAETGLLTLFCQHSSASIAIQENCDPDVMRDLEDAFARMAPQGGAELYRHHAEGPDDMPGHIRTVLSGVNIAVPVIGGRLALGRWQGIFLWEHRTPARRRSVALHLLAD
ncbi:MAG TPA: secondary thiamine-phosphate synthase enzyme YjbQ [Thermohalobaculum sp.]|nr:secondary thiamine-phosphate synthase enzyme YjbQ [Thermohalobaculum sp.]